MLTVQVSDSSREELEKVATERRALLVLERCWRGAALASMSEVVGLEDKSMMKSQIQKPDDDDALSVQSLPALSYFERLYRQHHMVLSTCHELTLLLLVGVLSTLTAALVDRSVDTLFDWRVRLLHDMDGSWMRYDSYLAWTVTSMACAGVSAACVQFIGPGAAGSGIPQMKCVLAGVRIHDYLSLRTLIAKMISLILAQGGGLSVGKEGPFTHMACCVANQLLHLPAFRSINKNEHLRKQVLSAACAAGVAAFCGAPVGGVLFSIEVTASFYSINHLWKAMFTAAVGAVVFRWARVFGSLKLFDLTSFKPQDFDFFKGEVTTRGTRMTVAAACGVACPLLTAVPTHMSRVAFALLHSGRLLRPTWRCLCPLPRFARRNHPQDAIARLRCPTQVEPPRYPACARVGSHRRARRRQKRLEVFFEQRVAHASAAAPSTLVPQLHGRAGRGALEWRGRRPIRPWQ